MSDRELIALGIFCSQIFKFGVLTGTSPYAKEPGGGGVPGHFGAKNYYTATNKAMMGHRVRVLLTAYLMVEGFFLSARSTDRMVSLLRKRSVLPIAGGLGKASWRVSGQLAEKKSSFTAQNSA